MNDTSLRDKIIQDVMGGMGFSSVIDILAFILGLILSVAAISAVAALAINIVKFTRASDNSGERNRAKDNIMTCLICLAVIGSFSVFFGILISFVF